MNELIIQDFGFAYGRNKVFQNFSARFGEGIHVLLGENGSGKTTLFQVLSTVFSLQKGRITLNGISYETPAAVRPLIAYLPQDFNVYPNMKVKHFLEFVAQVKNKKPLKAVQASVIKAMERTATIDFKDKKMKELSGGMRRRVGIAQALLSEAVLIVADEPTAGLDPEQRLLFNRLLRDIAHDRIVLLSTHIIEDIQHFYQDIAILSHGQLKCQGTAQDLTAQLQGRCYEFLCWPSDVEKIKKQYHVLDLEEMKEGTKTTIALRPGEQLPYGAWPLESITLQHVWSYYI